MKKKKGEEIEIGKRKQPKTPTKLKPAHGPFSLLPIPNLAAHSSSPAGPAHSSRADPLPGASTAAQSSLSLPVAVSLPSTDRPAQHRSLSPRSPQHERTHTREPCVAPPAAFGRRGPPAPRVDKLPPRTSPPTTPPVGAAPLAVDTPVAQAVSSSRLRVTPRCSSRCASGPMRQRPPSPSFPPPRNCRARDDR